MEKNPLNTATKTRLDGAKTAYIKVVQKIAGATGELIGNRFTEETFKQKPALDVNSRNIEEIVVLPKKRKEILNELRQEL